MILDCAPSNMAALDKLYLKLWQRGMILGDLPQEEHFASNLQISLLLYFPQSPNQSVYLQFVDKGEVDITTVARDLPNHPRTTYQ